MTKLLCSLCHKNFTEDSTVKFYRCFSCREKIPVGETVHEMLDLFNGLIFHESNIKTAHSVWFYGQSKYWWLCQRGHLFFQSPKNILDGSRCNVCFSQKKFKVENSLSSHSPDISLEWNYERNDFSPHDYSFGSGANVWWRCNKCHHEWKATIKSRTNRNQGNGCPKCSEMFYRSRGELQLLNYIRTIYDGRIVENARNVINNGELDIYLPDVRLAIEYNGDYWHSDAHLLSKYGKTSQFYHHEKYVKCCSKNIELFYVWESDWSVNAMTIKTLLQQIICDHGDGAGDYFLLQRFSNSLV